MVVCTISFFISAFLFLAEAQPNTSAIAERLRCLSRKAECDLDFGCKVRLRTIAIRCNVEIFYKDEDVVFQKPITQCTEDCKEEIEKLVKYRAGLELVSMEIKNDDPNACFALGQRAQSCLKEIGESRMQFPVSTVLSCTTVFTICKLNKRCSKILFPSYNICNRFLYLNQTTSLCHSQCPMMIKDIDIENRKATYWAQILVKCRCHQSDVNCQNFPETFENIKSRCPPKHIVLNPGEVTRVSPTSFKLPKTAPTTNAGNVECFFIVSSLLSFVLVL